MSSLGPGASILVVGGAGFVGSNLVRSIAALEPERVVVIDNLLSAERTEVLGLPVVSFIEGSIADEEILHAVDDGFDYVFHLATFHGNQNSIFDPIADHDNNLVTSLKLFHHLVGRSRLKKVVYASAGCTVAPKVSSGAVATDESAPIGAFFDSPYQISKVVGELYANYFWSLHGVPIVKARFQNVYGPWEILGAGRWRGTPATVWRNVVPTFVYRALEGLPLVLDNGGLATRDFVYVGDVIDGLERCAAVGEPGEVYNLATGVETSIRELADLITREARSDGAVVAGPPRRWDHSGARFGSTAKAASELGFTAKVDLGEGIARTVDWTRRHLEMIRTTIERHRDRLDSP